jgi:hypothetical protein
MVAKTRIQEPQTKKHPASDDEVNHFEIEEAAHPACGVRE